MTAMIEDRHDVHEASRLEARSEGQGTASVLKALQLLDAFRDGGPVLGVSEIGRRVGVPTSTAFRLLAYLVEGGFVSKEGTRYRLGDKLFELGNQVALCRPKGLREQASPYLGELYAATGMTVRLAVPEGSEIVLVDKIVGLRTVPAPTAIGGRAPSTCTGLGKAMLAFQPAATVAQVLQGPLPRPTRYSPIHPRLLQKQLIDIRSTGLAYDLEESVLGQVCVAAPILHRGVAVAAISVSARTHQTNLAQSTAALQRAASQLQKTLGA